VEGRCGGGPLILHNHWKVLLSLLLFMEAIELILYVIVTNKSLWTIENPFINPTQKYWNSNRRGNYTKTKNSNRYHQNYRIRTIEVQLLHKDLVQQEWSWIEANGHIMLKKFGQNKPRNKNIIKFTWHESRKPNFKTHFFLAPPLLPPKKFHKQKRIWNISIK
jgi:hypothetical protein